MRLTLELKNILFPRLSVLQSVARSCYAIVRSQFTQVHDNLRALLALPCRLGGLGLVNPTSTADQEYSASRKVTSPVVNAILTHDDRYTYDTLADQLSSVAEAKEMKRDHQSSSSSQLKASLPPDLQRAMDLSMEKGASNWLTVLPVDEFGFTLHKGAFRDALALRYGWSLHQIPHTCPCGTTFSVEHALSCAKGG